MIMRVVKRKRRRRPFDKPFIFGGWCRGGGCHGGSCHDGGNGGGSGGGRGGGSGGDAA